MKKDKFISICADDFGIPEKVDSAIIELIADKRITDTSCMVLSENFKNSSKELKKLSRSQGRILIKLVHRQTGTTTHDLVKELRNGWRAFIYQTTASLFDLTLKDTFDPKANREDFMIEDILQRANSDNIIELDPTALTYNLDSLYQIWRTKKTDTIP